MLEKSKYLRFYLGQIDIDVYPNLAEEFGVSKDPASFDLPTLILFQQGKEIRRLPELTMPKEGTKLTKASAAKDAITRLGWNKKSVSLVHTCKKTHTNFLLFVVYCRYCFSIRKDRKRKNKLKQSLFIYLTCSDSFCF